MKLGATPISAVPEAMQSNLPSSEILCSMPIRARADATTARRAGTSSARDCSMARPGRVATVQSAIRTQRAVDHGQAQVGQVEDTRTAEEAPSCSAARFGTPLHTTRYMMVTGVATTKAGTPCSDSRLTRQLPPEAARDGDVQRRGVQGLQATAPSSPSALKPNASRPRDRLSRTFASAVSRRT
jgi:hypothetical protein